ncbi:MAG: LPXTG cell wall anchor domain-containing protein [Ruminococcus sp.]|nr:LPXTG cell wall anchor domain-containing protein [Ruminococcus sp.]
MKLKKLVIGVTAATVLASSLATVCASADWTPTEGQYNATMYIANGDWSVSSMYPQGYRGDYDDDGRADGGYVQDAIVTGDGTYTVRLEFPPDGDTEGGDEYITGKITDGVCENRECNTWNSETGTGEFYAVTVFTIDIIGLLDGTETFNDDKTGYEENTATVSSNFGESAGPYKASLITATVDSIVQDDEEVEFNADEVICGNIENQNYNYRIEIFNAYGDTGDGRVIADDDIDFMYYLEVTFTISGLDAQDGSTSSETTASTTASSSSDSEDTTESADTDSSSTTNGSSSTSTTTTSSSTGADTGASAGLALGGIALAGVAIVLAKKRK